VLNWPDAPFTGPDRLAKIITPRASLGLLTCIDDGPTHYLELDYATAASAPGGHRRARLARDFLKGVFGARAIRNLRVLAATDWMADPWSRSSWSVVPPGRVSIRDALAEPVGQRIWFAGEAGSRSLWGTVGGAWEEGERAAREAMAHLARPAARPACRAAPSRVPLEARNDVSAGSVACRRRDSGMPAPMLTYAVGDIHGCLDHLLRLLDRIEADAAGRRYRLVFVGDYIDRGRTAPA
jgi:hypothetical protein